MQARVAARIAAIALAGLGYVAGSHWLMVHTQESAWNVVGVLSPMLILVGLGAWRSAHRWLSVAAALALAALCVQAWMGVKVTAHALYLLQHAGINGFVGLVFASTLRPGRVPLITMLALRVHGGSISDGHAAYTRRLTLVWVIFFAVVVAGSLALFAWAPFETWAVFANILTPVGVGGLFIGEYLMRYRLHPEFERSTVADAIRAYTQAAKPAAQKVSP